MWRSENIRNFPNWILIMCSSKTFLQCLLMTGMIPKPTFHCQIAGMMYCDISLCDLIVEYIRCYNSFSCDNLEMSQSLLTEPPLQTEPSLAPIKRRYIHSAQFDKTNFAFGDDAWGPLTTYDKDYTAKMPMPPGGMSEEPSCRDSHMQRILDLSKLPIVLKTEDDDILSNDEDTAQNSLTNGKKEELKERRKMLQKTNFTFGNDAMERTTAYCAFASSSSGQSQKRLPCTPPEPAEILPASKGSAYKNSIQGNDYNYFGPWISNAVHEGRYDHLEKIKDINTFDSVRYSLRGPTRRMLTRSMVDYRHPLDRVAGNLRELMAQSISPAVRKDSIWTSVNTGDSHLSTENRTKFTWPRREVIPRRRLPPVGR